MSLRTFSVDDPDTVLLARRHCEERAIASRVKAADVIQIIRLDRWGKWP